MSPTGSRGSSRTGPELLDTVGRHLQGYLGSVPGSLKVPLPAKRKKPPVLRALRHEYCDRDFDPNSPETAQALLDIWNAAFPQEPLATAADGEHWKRLGFQSRTPGTDVRAGGLPLQQLRQLAARHPELLRRLAAEALEAGYPLACSCFNVTQLLVVFFGLSKRPSVSPVSGAAGASSSQLWNFADLCARSAEGAPAVLDELFRALVERLHDVWRLLRATEGLSLMDFERALSEVHGANALFWRSPHASVAELRDLAVAGPLQQDKDSDSDSSSERSTGRRSSRGRRGEPCVGADVYAWLESCRALVANALGGQGEGPRTLGVATSLEPRGWCSAERLEGAAGRSASARKQASAGGRHKHRRQEVRESDPPLFGGGHASI